jgi:hypothetical protein
MKRLLVVSDINEYHPFDSSSESSSFKSFLGYFDEIFICSPLQLATFPASILLEERHSFMVESGIDKASNQLGLQYKEDSR